MTQSLASTAKREPASANKARPSSVSLCLVSSSRAAMVKTSPGKSTMRVRA